MALFTDNPAPEHGPLRQSVIPFRSPDRLTQHGISGSRPVDNTEELDTEFMQHRTLDVAGAALDLGKAYKTYSELAYAQDATPEQIQSVMDIGSHAERKAMSVHPDVKSPFFQSYYNAVNSGALMLGGAPEAVAGGVAGGIIGLATGGPAGAGAGAKIGAKAGTLAYWSDLGTGILMKKMLDDNIPFEEAQTLAKIGGPIYGAIEFMQLSHIVGVASPKRKILRSGIKTLAKQGWDLSKAYVSELGEEGLQKIVEEGMPILSKYL